MPSESDSFRLVTRLSPRLASLGAVIEGGHRALKPLGGFSFWITWDFARANQLIVVRSRHQPIVPLKPPVPQPGAFHFQAKTDASCTSSATILSSSSFLSVHR